MPRVFRKQIVRYLDADGRQVPKGTPGARRHKEKSAKWYGRVPGEPKPVPLCSNKTASALLLADLIRKAENAKAGITVPCEKHRAVPLLCGDCKSKGRLANGTACPCPNGSHLSDYRRELEAKGDDPRHVRIVVSRLAALLDGCGFRLVADLSASAVNDYLAGLRRDRRPDALPGKDSFTAKEAAAVLGIKPASVGTAVRRHRLAAEGQGKKRRFPRATVEALQDKLCRGASMQTTNQYLIHLRGFCRWLVKDRRMPDNPLAHLERGNPDVDRRHDRRELEAAELRKLLEVTRASARAFRGLTGPDRFALYVTACGTGFRASGLASLTPESFDLDADPPTVVLAARRNKSRKLREQPLPADVAELLRAYLAGRPLGVPVCGGTWARHGKGAEMLRIDLEAAGIPYEVPGPDGPLFADFHALRHTYLTLGGRAGIDLRTLQELAGHSSPILTARYSHRRLYDLAGAVEKLPNFLPPGGPTGRRPVSVAHQLLTRLTAAAGECWWVRVRLRQKGRRGPAATP
jgi:excisionase family DNA binding protein